MPKNQLPVVYGDPDSTVVDKPKYVLTFHLDVWTDDYGPGKIHILKQRGTTQVAVMTELHGIVWIEKYTIRPLSAISEYQRKVLGNILENKAKLSEMGLSNSQFVTPVKPVKKRVRFATPPSTVAMPNVTTRRTGAVASVIYNSESNNSEEEEENHDDAEGEGEGEDEDEGEGEGEGEGEDDGEAEGDGEGEGEPDWREGDWPKEDGWSEEEGEEGLPYDDDGEVNVDDDDEKEYPADKSEDARFVKLDNRLEKMEASLERFQADMLSIVSQSREGGGRGKGPRKRQCTKKARAAAGVDFEVDFDPKVNTVKSITYKIQPFIQALIDPSEDSLRENITVTAMQLNQEKVRPCLTCCAHVVPA
jgi:hypothetical protein